MFMASTHDHQKDIKLTGNKSHRDLCTLQCHSILAVEANRVTGTGRN